MIGNFQFKIRMLYLIIKTKIRDEITYKSQIKTSPIETPKVRVKLNTNKQLIIMILF